VILVYFRQGNCAHDRMDGSAKPERKNPRQKANTLSQLIFAWAVPLLYRGSRHGLNTEDLTECLKEDNSEQLGDRLEEYETIAPFIFSVSNLKSLAVSGTRN